MIIEHLAELLRQLEKDLAQGTEQRDDLIKRVNNWDKYCQMRAKEILELQIIIQNAQTPKEDPE